MRDIPPNFVDRSKGYLRAHPEVTMFAVGALIFSAGLITVFLTRAGSGDSPSQEQRPSVAAAGTAPARTGPQGGEPLDSYISRKRTLLTQSAATQPRRVVQAVISFDSYRKVGDVANFIRSNKVEALVIHWRIPLPIFEPMQAPTSGRSVTETVADAIGPQRIAELTAELKELESLLRDVDDPDFEAVYREDAESHRKAIALLKSDPGVIFAVVVKAQLSQLAKVGLVSDVRLVDLPEGPAPPEFVGILPEQL